MAHFEKLPKLYREQMQQYGFAFEAHAFETCNSGAYSCPLCGASDRDRLYALYLKSHIPAQGKFSLLDIAPSPPLSRYIRGRFDIEYRTADLFMADVDDKIDVTSMDYPDARFDAFVCSHVLEHVVDDKRAMAELYRILKPGGWGITMVPIAKQASNIEYRDSLSEAERWRFFGQGDHVRIYSRDVFVQRLGQAGYEVELLRPVDLSESDVIERSGIAASSVLYIAKKPRSSI